MARGVERNARAALFACARGRRFAAHAAIALAGLVAACGGAPESPPPAVVRPAPPAAEADVAATRRRWLELQAVQEKLERRVLYTWTTDAQVDEIARDKRLLLRKDGENGKRSVFDERATAGPGTPLAVLVRLPPFTRRRFAWPNPWATSRGFGSESYGRRLVRVVLRMDSVIGVLEPKVASFIDLEGKPVADYEMIRHPARLAAVYHVRPADPAKGESSFREYVLVNEAQIEQWSVGTPEIRERLELDAAMLHLVAHGIAAEAPHAGGRDGWARAALEGPWQTVSRSASDRDLYEAGLAFLSDAYAPLPATIEAVAQGLEALPPQGVPLVHRPDATFPVDQLVPEPQPGQPRPCIHHGSMCVPIGK